MRLDVLSAMHSHSVMQQAQAQVLTYVENLRESIQDDMAGWSQVGGKNLDTLNFREDIPTLRLESRKSYYRTPHGRGMIRTMVKFVIGAGVIIDFAEKDPKKLENILKHWKKFKKNIKWFSFLEEFVRRTFRDGEVFLRKIRKKGEPLSFRFIDPDYILDEGIQADPNDAETIQYYVIKGKDGAADVKVDAADIIHLKLDADRNMKRGRPLLEVQFPLLTKFAKWLEARMVLSQVRTSVALVREVQGSPMDLSRMRSNMAANRTTTNETNKAKMLRPGSILSSTPGSKWSMLSPNLDARDASTDGRNLQLSMAAGSGLPDVFVTQDFANSNFACHSEDTEILTTLGWVRWEKLNYADYVATWNLSSGKIEFQHPTKIHSFPYKGFLYVHEGKFAVTPNHEMIVADYPAKKDHDAELLSPSFYKKVQIQHLNQSRFYLPPIKNEPSQILDVSLLKKEPYEGMVWCATVPNGSLITRRDGKPLISGNSTVVSQNPAIREFEYAQNIFAEPLSDIVESVILDGMEQGKIPAKRISSATDDEVEFDINTDFEIKYPPLIKRDLAQEVSAYKTLNDMRALSLRTITLRIGEDPDAERMQIEEEDSQGLTPPAPKNTPAPVVDNTVNHRKAIAPKGPAERKPRQNVQV